MRVDDVAEAIIAKQDDLYQRLTESTKEPVLAIYMTDEYHSLCNIEIQRYHGRVSNAASEFLHSGRNSILGYEVYRVVVYSDQTHPDYRIMEIES